MMARQGVVWVGGRRTAALSSHDVDDRVRVSDDVGGTLYGGGPTSPVQSDDGPMPIGYPAES